MPRQSKQATTDKTLALELLDGIAYSDEYRRGVQSALPPGAIAPEEFWVDLEAAFDAFLRWELRRLKRPPPAERARWQRRERLATALARDLADAHRQTPRAYSEPDWAKSPLRELVKLIDRSRAHIKAFDAIAKMYGGRRNASREFLYASVLELWVKHLGQKLKYSTTKFGAPGGPLIIFFQACVGPCLGDEAPTAHAVAAIVDRARYRVLPRRK
jgi:hypothetical protein